MISSLGPVPPAPTPAPVPDPVPPFSCCFLCLAVFFVLGVLSSRKSADYCLSQYEKESSKHYYVLEHRRAAGVFQSDR